MMFSSFESLGEQLKQSPRKANEPRKRRTMKERLSSLFQKPSNKKKTSSSVTKTLFLEEVFPFKTTPSVPPMNLTQLTLDRIQTVFISHDSPISAESSVNSFTPSATTRGSSSVSALHGFLQVDTENFLWAFVLIVFGLRLYWGLKEDHSHNNRKSSKLQSETKEADDEIVPDLKCLLLEGECSETDSPLSSPKRKGIRKGISLQTTKDEYILHLEENENVDKMALQKPSPSLIQLSQLLRRIFDFPKKAFLYDGLGLKNRNDPKEQQKGTDNVNSTFHLQPHEIRRRAASLLYSTLDTNTCTRSSSVPAAFSMASSIIPENQFYPAMLSAPLLSVTPTSTSTKAASSHSQTKNIQ